MYVVTAETYIYIYVIYVSGDGHLFASYYFQPKYRPTYSINKICCKRSKDSADKKLIKIKIWDKHEHLTHK